MKIIRVAEESIEPMKDSRRLFRSTEYSLKPVKISHRYGNFFLVWIFSAFASFSCFGQNQGFIDTTFQVGTGAVNGVKVIKVQTDGKIVIGGWFTSYNGVPRNRLGRLHQNGTLDTTFKVGSGANDDITDIAIQADNKIIIVGKFTSFNGIGRRRVARINQNGSVDTSFNPGTGSSIIINSVVVQVDNKIVLGGGFQSFNGRNYSYLVRLNHNGSHDTLYNNKLGFDGPIWALSLQNDGKIIVAGGFLTFRGLPIKRLLRLLEDGTLDSSFQVGDGPNSLVTCTDIQEDGKILIGGIFTRFNQRVANRVARVNINGSFDSTFSVGSGPNNSVFCISHQKNGKIFLGGQFNTFQNRQVKGGVRVLNSGNYDDNFKVRTDINCILWGTFILRNGKILIGGSFTVNNGASRGIARLTGDTCNPSFSFIQQAICPGQSFLGYSSPGTYIDTLVSSLGCDSIRTLTLSIKPVSTFSQNIRLCKNQSLQVGTRVYNRAGVYLDTLVAANGCDSLVTSTLNYDIPNDTVLVVAGVGLEAAPGQSSYQWLDCNNGFAPIVGQSDSVFRPTRGGSYAVRVLKGNCADTSICLTVTQARHHTSNNIRIYPQPVSDKLFLLTQDNQPISELILFDAMGRKVLKEKGENIQVVSVSKLPEGLYQLKVWQGNRIEAFRVILKR